MSFCPMRILLLVKLFHALSWATVQPCLSAILPNTSPLFTIYVVAFAGADEVLAAVVDDDDDDVEAVDDDVDAGALPPR